MFGLRKFSPDIAEVQILIIFFPFLTAYYKNIEQLQRLFLVVWQRVRR